MSRAGRRISNVSFNSRLRATAVLIAFICGAGLLGEPEHTLNPGFQAPHTPLAAHSHL